MQQAQSAATTAQPDNQYALFGKLSSSGSRRPRYDFPALLAVPKAIPRPSVSDVIAETDAAVAEFVPIARRLFLLPDDWHVGPTNMHWEWWGSSCRYIDGEYCLWFDFAPLICLEDDDFAVAHEYGIYRNDSVIGQIATTDWRIHVRLTVAHELAHAVQNSLPTTTTPLHKGGQFYEGLGVFDTGHGAFFQEIYARFRKELINPLVPADAIGKPGARTRTKTPPDLNEVPHPLVGKVINHPKHGRLEAVMVKKTAVYTTGGLRHDFTPIPIGRFEKLCTGSAAPA